MKTAITNVNMWRKKTISCGMFARKRIAHNRVCIPLTADGRHAYYTSFFVKVERTAGESFVCAHWALREKGAC